MEELKKARQEGSVFKTGGATIMLESKTQLPSEQPTPKNMLSPRERSPRESSILSSIAKTEPNSTAKKVTTLLESESGSKIMWI